MPVAQAGEGGGVQVEGCAEGGVDRRSDVDAAILDVDGGEAAGGGGVVEVGVVGQDLLLDGWGVHREAFEIVVAVALDALDAQGGADGQVLQQGDRADVGEVFAGEEVGG